VERFNRARLDRTVLNRKRVELGLLSETPVIGFVGRLVQEKGILELWQAVQRVKKCLPNLRLLMIGPLDDQKPDALTPEMAKAYGLAQSCIFTGTRHDMPELYALMDLFVLPSHRESFPRSPMEASAMGVPCIVTDIPGCREVVEHGQNGWLVPPNDVPALAEAIVKLLTDRAQARQMSETGRKIAHERFDEQLVFARAKAEYTRLLQAKGLPVPASQLELMAA